jgi:Fe-coproporphyrin III synthase
MRTQTTLNALVTAGATSVQGLENIVPSACIRFYYWLVAATTPAIRNPADRALARLPLVTLYLTERCNSRCVSCDYWRYGKTDVSVESVARLIPDLQELQTQVVLVSGGEPLLHPNWIEIAELLRGAGLRLWLLTSGLSLAKYANRVMQLFESVTVSLDAADAESYMAIRGLDAFKVVCKGIRSMTAEGVPTSVRVTVQRGNYRQLPALVLLAKQLDVRQVSFLAADVSNPHAFGRTGEWSSNVALQADDLPRLERVLNDLEREHIEDYRSGFIAESPQKMRRLLQYYAAICGIGTFPPTRCNAPDFSAVIAADGQVHPCFFISGPKLTVEGNGLAGVLNSSELMGLRADIRNGQRAECKTCVCTLWRNPADFSTWNVLQSRQHRI